MIDFLIVAGTLAVVVLAIWHASRPGSSPFRHPGTSAIIRLPGSHQEPTSAQRDELQALAERVYRELRSSGYGADEVSYLAALVRQKTIQR